MAAGPRQGGHALADSPAKEASDAARWWQAYRLAEEGEIDELRQRADGGDDHARQQLACWMGERGRPQEAVALIRPLADAGEDIAQRWLARWLAESDQAGELRRRASASASAGAPALAMTTPSMSWPAGSPD